MKYYKIIIEEIVKTEENKYPEKTEIFTQIIQEEQMTKGLYLGIIKAVNDLPPYTNA